MSRANKFFAHIWWYKGYYFALYILFHNFSQLLHWLAINSDAFNAILQVGAEKSIEFTAYLIVKLNLLQALVCRTCDKWSICGFIGTEIDQSQEFWSIMILVPTTNSGNVLWWIVKCDLQNSVLIIASLL